ncbi:MAG: glycosyltransferase [Pseudomonadota bacterium]
MPIGPSAAGHPLLEQALRSIAAQAETVQLAVLDASGRADVAETLDRYAGLIQHRRTGPDSGQAAAIQEGWDALDADVLGWLNADDLLYPDALRMASQALDDYPDADWITGQSLFFDHDPATGRFVFTGLHPEAAAPSDRLFRTNTVSQPSTFVRREALDRVGWLNTDLHYTMDWDLWARLRSAGFSAHYVPVPLSAVLMAQGTKTSSFNANRRREIRALVNRHAGPYAAWKSLAAFWLTHRADQETGRGPFTALRDLLRRPTASQAVSESGSEPCRLVHYSDGILELEDGTEVPPGTIHHACALSSGSEDPGTVRLVPAGSERE